jgi:hypothetical protein
LNQLNSLIIEGSVESFQDVSVGSAFPICSFVLVNTRYVSKDRVPEVARVKVRARGELAKSCISGGIPDGATVKVVGWLFNDEGAGCPCVVVEAEFVDFKGGRKRKDSQAAVEGVGE